MCNKLIGKRTEVHSINWQIFEILKFVAMMQAIWELKTRKKSKQYYQR